ncbi:MAG: transposase [Candidatus Competibacteraceae bacterium]|nr:transposase [Candidatus Competibacteraceae bacterium]
MAAPSPRLRKQLSAPGLLQTIRRCFEQVPEHRNERNQIPLADALMSGLAVFGLKYPSLLKFDEAYNEGVIRHNLNTLYAVERAPCDTQMRTILDPVDPAELRPAFRAVHRQVQRHKALEPYRYLDGYYLVSVDGTGQFASGAIHCAECCRKTVKGQIRYYHQLLGAVIVHPDLKTVLPLAPEAITRQDGMRKNDCERNAAKRLLTQLRGDYPQLKWLVVEDSLAANGPHLELLRALDLRYVIHVKPGDHEALFAAVQEQLVTGTCQEWEYTDAQGVEHGYRWVNALPLNKTHPHLQVNFLEYWEIDGDQQRLFSWITDIELTPDNVEPLMRGGRARWKVENETFNTLKNQGYDLEHNYGHGSQHLATVLALLMMLAFLVDQVQELGCRLFQAARAHCRSRTSLWERLRALFTGYYIPDWKPLWEAIATGHVPAVLAPNTS